ncbi:MAG: type III-B CRISPR module RAMP protein Cmr1 [Akkermansiaceae bacterium]|nr:type III-B CRISPR module RAMP protein Cmr1 [Akkermansiaceae bacterium]
MIRLTCNLELITPCLCGGAEPNKQAEIRPASIRGQLRWWFRVLGGFKSLAAQGMSDREQEEMIFGSAAGDGRKSGKLIVRVRMTRIQQSRRDSEALGHRPFSDPAYLTFPMQSRKNVDGSRGVIDSGTFDLILTWRGATEFRPDLAALTTVYGNLGSLGFRSRRAMGALCLLEPESGLTAALNRFSTANAITIRSMSANSASNAISKLGAWLRQWRSHGRSIDHAKNRGDANQPPQNCGFAFAKRDHDIGYGNPDVRSDPAFRPALGLPIIQRTGRGTNNWEFGRGTFQEPKGRFASPVILRPHKDAQGNWHALVIFVDAKQWPDDPAKGRPKSVYINGQLRTVSRDLYDAMKADAPGYLQSFP